jgi:hypothetical protein
MVPTLREKETGNLSSSEKFSSLKMYGKMNQPEPKNRAI